jgi:hypothetical protein
MKVGFHALAAFALLVVACDKRNVPVSTETPLDETYALTSSWPTFAQGVDRGPAAKMDILVMVDNSFSMKPLQDKLNTSFAELMSALDALPGGAPDLHVGVISSDVGAGVYGADQVTGCIYGGDQGKLQNAPRGDCVGVTLTDSFLSLHGDATTGVPVTNYGAVPLARAFGCIAALGQGGCGFEQPFFSVMRALGIDGHGGAPPMNAGFLRDDAYLAVVLVTNEDDCSAPLDSTLFDPTSTQVSDPLGPLTSYRCNRFGHLCKLDGHEGPPSLTSAETYESCRSNENGRLTKVADFVATLKDLKRDPARIFFAAVTGPSVPYVVKVGGASEVPQAAYVEHSCTQTDGTFADPGVRLLEAVQGFGAQGVFQTICDDTLAPAMRQISEALAKPLLPPCVDVPAGGPGCTVIERWVDGAGKQAARVPSCDASAGVTPCFTLTDDAATCGPKKRLAVDRGSATPPAHLFTAVDCTTAHP